MRTWLWIYWPLAILFGGVAIPVLHRALFGDRARGRRRCPRCWYDMGGIPGLRCPECGRVASGERALSRTRRRWRLATIGVLAAAMSVATVMAGRAVLAGSWWMAVPEPIVLLTAQVYEDPGDHVFDRICAMVQRTPRGLSYPESWLAARYLGTVARDDPPGAKPRASSRGAASAHLVRFMGPAATGALSSLMAMAEQTGHPHHRIALDTLAELGPRAAAALPSLERSYSRDTDELNRLAAIVAGYRIGRPVTRVRDLLLAASSDADPYVRGAAVFGIERLRLDGREVVTALDRLSMDEAPFVRFPAAELVSRLKQSAAK